MSALFELAPALADRLGWVRLGAWPSALDVQRVLGREVFFKREDLSAPAYAGNKIRPLEMVFGAALAAGKSRVWATGAFGSNHALATVLQAPRVGLRAGAMLWPQPPSATARANLEATLSSGCDLVLLRSIALFPGRAWLQGRNSDDWVMPPGAATPLGALGHASAAAELAGQLAAAGAVGPGVIVLPAGSTCTTVGMLVGTALVRALGAGFPQGVPHVHAVRVTPWPVTSALRIARLAVRTAAFLAEHGGPRLSLTVRDVLARLTVHGRYIGGGYGRPTADGINAVLAFTPRGPRLDTTYSAKAASFLLDALPRLPDPVTFWATKSAVPLPAVDPAAIAVAPAYVRKWMRT